MPDFSLPEPNVPLVIEGGRISPAWYQRLAPLVSYSNSLTPAASHATNADVYAATPGKVLTAGLLASASARISIPDAEPIGINWASFIYGFVDNIAGNRTIGNPTNGQPGTWRTLLVRANDATPRLLTFGNQYVNPPLINDLTNSHFYLLSMFCVDPTYFLVTAIQASTS